MRPTREGLCGGIRVSRIRRFLPACRHSSAKRASLRVSGFKSLPQFRMRQQNPRRSSSDIKNSYDSSTRLVEVEREGATRGGGAQHRACKARMVARTAAACFLLRHRRANPLAAPRIRRRLRLTNLRGTSVVTESFLMAQTPPKMSAIGWCEKQEKDKRGEGGTYLMWVSGFALAGGSLARRVGEDGSKEKNTSDSCRSALKCRTRSASLEEHATAQSEREDDIQPKLYNKIQSNLVHTILHIQEVQQRNFLA